MMHTLLPIYPLSGASAVGVASSCVEKHVESITVFDYYDDVSELQNAAYCFYATDDCGVSNLHQRWAICSAYWTWETRDTAYKFVKQSVVKITPKFVKKIFLKI